MRDSRAIECLILLKVWLEGPCTVKGIAAAMPVKPNRVWCILDELVSRRCVRTINIPGPRGPGAPHHYAITDKGEGLCRDLCTLFDELSGFGPSPIIL